MRDYSFNARINVFSSFSGWYRITHTFIMTGGSIEKKKLKSIFDFANIVTKIWLFFSNFSSLCGNKFQLAIPKSLSKAFCEVSTVAAYFA